jgi:tetratricopeptide (TPR) repeat protein
MNEQKAIWYIVGEDNQQTGPYTTEQIFEFLKKRKISKTTYCWREGMPDWQALNSVEPFKTEIERRKKRALQIVIAAIIVICAIGAAVAAYFIIMGPPEVRHAKELIKKGFYKGASEVLQPYVERNPLKYEASYLLAISKIDEYATATQNQDIFGGLFSSKTPMEEAKQLLERIFKAEPKWIEKAKADIAEAASRIPSTTPDNLNRHLEISRLRAELNLADKKQLAGELLDKLSSQGGLQGNFYNRNQEAALEILNWDPSLISRIIALALGDENVSTPQLSTAIMILQNWARERPAMAEAISSALLSRAETFYAKNNREQAKLLLSKALEINPQVIKAEEQAFLCIRLMEPDDAKLTRCQRFLRDYPDSSHRFDVLMIIVRDATAISKGYGSWNQAKAEPYSKEGTDSAKKLIEQNPKMPNLDVEVFELAKKLAENKKLEEAVELSSDLLAAIPESAIKLQIETAIAEWSKDNLPPELRELAKRVDKELGPKTVTLSTPAAVPALTADHTAVRVIQIADNCTADKFNSQQKDMLLEWVADGGILWVNNNVLSVFDIDHSIGWGSSQRCQPAISPQRCPILTGCSYVVVSRNERAAYNLNYTNVIPLLTASDGARQFCYWSLIPYGKGYVSDVKTVDRQKDDGARFWLNFRLYCLGWDIPDAPPPPPPPPPNGHPLSPLTTINSVEELEKALSGDTTGCKVLWVRLDKKTIGNENIEKLKNWTQEGNALWLETDAAEAFGFGNVIRIPLGRSRDVAEVADIHHPIVEGLQGKLVRYEVSANGGIFSGSQNVTPLLVQFHKIQQQRRSTVIVYVFCALRSYGKGIVVFRPANIDTTTGPGQRFNDNLKSFCLKTEQQNWRQDILLPLENHEDYQQ